MRERRIGLLLAIAASIALLVVALTVVNYNTATKELSREAPPEEALSWNALRNADYPSEFPRGKVARLSNGVYEEAYAPGSAMKLTIRLADFGAFGQLDEDPAIDAAVIVISDPGGSGTFVHLVAALNRDGKPNASKPVLLGDRIAVRAIRIENRKIYLRMRIRSPDDPMVKLTREVSRTYSLANGELVLESETTAEVPSVPVEQFSHNPELVEVAVGGGPKMMASTLKPGGIADYVVRAEAGQRLRISLRSQFNNAILSVFGLSDAAQLVKRSEYVTNWSGALPASQEYAVKVITLAGHDLEYLLSVELLPAVPTPTPTVAPSPVPRPTSTATPAPPPSPPSVGNVPILVQGDLKLSERPLADLSPEASHFLQTRDAIWGLAVVVPGQNIVYLENADQQLETASVVKVLIMLSVFDQAKLENRYVGQDELELLWPMITESDNDSATHLWNQIGGGARVKAYLNRIGVTDINPFVGPYYGTTLASARAVATVLTRLAFGDLLDETDRKHAVQMLLNVVRPQRWGVPFGAETQQAHRDRVGLKNGWYPEERGWRVNSVGFIVSPTAAQPAYTIVVMTNRQRDFRYGVDTIEGAASRIHAALHP